MIRLFIKEDYRTEQNQMIVQNHIGEDLYLIVGKWGRAGDSLSLNSLNGTKLVEAKQKILSIFPAFQLKVNQQDMGQMVKYPGVLGIYKPHYKVKKLKWEIRGNFEERHYIARRFAQKVMEIDKQFSNFGDLSSLKIYDEDNIELCCLISVLIDNYSTVRKGELQKESVRNMEMI